MIIVCLIPFSRRINYSFKYERTDSNLFESFFLKLKYILSVDLNIWSESSRLSLTTDYSVLKKITDVGQRVLLFVEDIPGKPPAVLC